MAEIEQSLLALLGEPKVLAYLAECNAPLLKRAVDALRLESDAPASQKFDLAQRATDLIGQYQKWEKFNDAARALARGSEKEGELEVDDRPATSRGDSNEDRGCYVQAWIWVPDPECPECGEHATLGTTGASFRCEKCRMAWPCPKCGGERISDCDDASANCDRQHGKPKAYHCSECGHSWPYEKGDKIVVEVYYGQQERTWRLLQVELDDRPCRDSHQLGAQAIAKAQERLKAMSQDAAFVGVYSITYPEQV